MYVLGVGIPLKEDRRKKRVIHKIHIPFEEKFNILFLVVPVQVYLKLYFLSDYTDAGCTSSALILCYYLLMFIFSYSSSTILLLLVVHLQ